MLLEGAKIRQLAGGRSKQDVKRGFALVESGGITRYFITSSSQEFSRWIGEITEVIDLYNTSCIASGVDDLDPRSGLEEEVTNNVRALDVDSADLSSHPSEYDGASQDGEGDNPGRVRRLGGRLAGAKTRIGAALESARQKGKEISERRSDSMTMQETDSQSGLRHDEEGTESDNTSLGARLVSADESGTASSIHNGENASSLAPLGSKGSDDPSNINRRRLQFGKALTGMKQATKNKLGTAIQNVRQKGTLQIPTRPLDGVRGKHRGLSPGPLERGDRSVSNRSTTASYDGSVGQGSTHGSYWTCKACTFINTMQNDAIDEPTCGMCGNTKTFIADGMECLNEGEAGVGETSSQRDLSDATVSVDTRGVILNDDSSRRGRFGAIGAVVRSVRQNSLDDSSETNQDPRGRGVSSRFNFRKRRPEGSTDPILYDDTVVTLNRVHASGFAPLTARSLTPRVPLKILEGKWVVSVKRKKTDSADALKPSLSSGSLVGIGSDDLSPHISSNNVHSQITNGEELDNDKYSAFETKQNGHSEANTYLFSIRTQRGDMAVNETVIDSACSIGMLMQLHATVSESVGEILPQLSYEHFARKEQARLSGLMDDTYDLVEHVLLTGRMLGGFFSHDVADEHLGKTRDYQGKIP